DTRGEPTSRKRASSWRKRGAFPSPRPWHRSCPAVAAMDRTLFIEEAAALLGVSRRTVYYRIREGRLQTIKTRCGSQRVLLSSLEALARDEAAKRNARRALPTRVPLHPDLRGVQP